MVRRGARKSRRSESGGSWVRLVLSVALLAWLLRSFLFAPFSIPSGSMLPTLYIGDYLMVAKWPYGFSRHSFLFEFPPFDGRILQKLPERGDVVVFVPPGSEGEDYVKRVIGLPGDTVAVRGGEVILNGRALTRTRTAPVAIPMSANSPCRQLTERGVQSTASDQGACAYPAYRETLPDGESYTVLDQIGDSAGDQFHRAKVPEGTVFLMGDNRDDSMDSRFSVAEGGIGFVPLENLVGRASFLFWSTNGSASYVKPWTWFSALRAGRIGTSLSPEQK